jgi:purine nucleoside phosphorylase
VESLQVIDYSSGREHTFFDGDDAQVTHVDFSWPYSAELRGILMEVGLQMGQPLAASGTYGSTNGPRLESAAEMTGMPEAALARELEIDYACLALVVNWAAGVGGSHISMQDILHNMEQGMQQAKSLLLAAARLIQQ